MRCTKTLKTTMLAVGLTFFSTMTHAADEPAMQRHLQEMQQTMQQIQQTKDPDKRQQLLARHMAQMQAAMKDMEGMMNHHDQGMAHGHGEMNHAGMQHGMAGHGGAGGNAMSMCEAHSQMMRAMMQQMQAQQQELEALRRRR